MCENSAKEFFWSLAVLHWFLLKVIDIINEAASTAATAGFLERQSVDIEFANMWSDLNAETAQIPKTDAFAVAGHSAVIKLQSNFVKQSRMK